MLYGQVPFSSSRAGGTTSGTNVMIHCCLSRYYALLRFVCSMIKQPQKAAVIETWGINKDKQLLT